MGAGIPKPDFTVTTANNRLGVPQGQTGTMTYDDAGNLTTDTYSAAAVLRAYDAENRMTKETQAGSYDAGIYTYDGDGRRVKRIVGGTETWQVYGLGGELLAEYAANTVAASPQKEYGYRNGQLLITATVTSGWGAAPTLNDNPLVANQTTVQARHITELREAINALRSHMSLSAYSWQYSATTNDYISANPILEMRTALDQALGAPSGGYSAGLAQYEPIKATHIQELRDRVLAAWTSGSSTEVIWLVSDQLGTPRMVFDQTGSLATMKRHDYLPFGEELFGGPPNQPGAGGRLTTQGYSSDTLRHKFTLKERDNETGLDYFAARYYASAAGRFTSCDSKIFSPDHIADPQRWNLLAYVENNPLTLIDPSGRDGEGQDGKKTITVFLNYAKETLDSGTYDQAGKFQKLATMDKPSWAALRDHAASKGYHLDTYDSNSLPLSSEGATASVENSEMVVVAGHVGRGVGGREATIPLNESFTKLIQAPGKDVYVGAINDSEITFSGKVFAVFGCNSAALPIDGMLAPTNPQAQFVGVQDVDGARGASVPGNNLAAYNFIEAYVNSGGNLEVARAAAQKVYQNSQNTHTDAAGRTIYDDRQDKVTSRTIH